MSKFCEIVAAKCKQKQIKNCRVFSQSSQENLSPSYLKEQLNGVLLLSEEQYTDFSDKRQWQMWWHIEPPALVEGVPVLGWGLDPDDF